MIATIRDPALRPAYARRVAGWIGMEPVEVERAVDAAARADMEETSRLATTIDTWWPAVLVALTEDVTNARTEGFNRIIKQTKRVGCGFTNMDNYRRRIMVHIALTRGQRPAA